MKVKYATIIVEDIDESIKFYREALGFEMDSQYDLGPARRITLMKSEGESLIELIQNEENKKGVVFSGNGFGRFRLHSKELKSKGTKIIMDPVEITVGTLAFIEDPNGARIALIQHH